MGNPNAQSGELGIDRQIGSLAAIGVGGSAQVYGRYLNVTLWGSFDAMVQLERSFDGGTTWHPCTDNAGTVQTWSVPMTIVIEEPEDGVLYRLNCTAYTSGTVNYRVSQ